MNVELTSIENQILELIKKCSDNDIEMFYKGPGKSESNEKQLALHSLVEKGFITINRKEWGLISLVR